MYYNKIKQLRNERLGKPVMADNFESKEMQVIVNIKEMPVTLRDVLRLIGKTKNHCDLQENGTMFHTDKDGYGGHFKLDLTLPISEQSKEVLEKLYKLVK